MSHRGVVIMALLALAVTAVVAGDHGTCTKSAGECAVHMRQMYQTRGWMGVELEQNEDGSLRISAVIGGGPAEKSGIKVDDTLVSVNGVALSKDTTESALMKDDDWKIGGVLAGRRDLDLQGEAGEDPRHAARQDHRDPRQRVSPDRQELTQPGMSCPTTRNGGTIDSWRSSRSEWCQENTPLPISS